MNSQYCTDIQSSNIWNNFSDKKLFCLCILNFCDVTLAGEDSHQINVHKMVLAASSLFKSYIILYKYWHPLIYLQVISISYWSLGIHRDFDFYRELLYFSMIFHICCLITNLHYKYDIENQWCVRMLIPPLYIIW